MVFTQCSILNGDSPFVRQRTVRIEKITILISSANPLWSVGRRYEANDPGSRHTLDFCCVNIVHKVSNLVLE